MTGQVQPGGKTHKSFALVFSGGGARGLSHAGVLRALISRGFVPSAIVGVSMGAVAGATYALNDNWFDALVDMDTSGFPATPDFRLPGLVARMRGLRTALLAARDMYFGWGVGAPTESWGRSVLSGLTQGKNLEDGRIPVFVCATDMLTGTRVVFGKGRATDYVYASAALAGILPPLVDGPHVLMDGAYADIAPVDVARATGAEVVIAVDPSQRENAVGPKNGMQAMLRSIEVCQYEHARLRFDQADLVIRPDFGRSIGTLEFGLKRRCIAAGAVATRRTYAEIAELLDPGQPKNLIMNIGDVAALSGLPAKTIRYYEDVGLVKPLRSTNGYRTFRESDAHKLAFLGRSRALGFSIEDCRNLIALYEDEKRASAEVKDIAEQHLERIDDKIAELKEMRATLAHLVDACAGDHRPDCPILADLATKHRDEEQLKNTAL